MIPCEKCGKVNPLGTRFCRGCGERLNVQFSQIKSSVKQTKSTQSQEGIQRSAREVLTIAAFLFICVLGAYYLLVPPLPPADLPPLHPDHLVPEHLGLPAAAATPAPLSNGRLGWRRAVGASVLAEAKVNLGQVHALQQELLAALQPDGSVAASNLLAATSLVALGLQACPDSAPTIDGAARARAWIGAHLTSLSLENPTARSLALYALIDAESLPAASLAQVGPYLTDGKAPVWQALALMELPAALRPTDLSALQDALGAATAPILTLLGHPSQGAGEDPYLDQPPNGPGEERLLWSVASWQLAPVPRQFIESMATWSSAVSPPALGAAGDLGGPSGPAAVQVLALCSAVLQPPVWLSH